MPARLKRQPNKTAIQRQRQPAVFNLTASDLFFQNSSIELALGNASKAIINVSGNLNVSNTNLTGAWNYANTLWNFYDATSLNFNAMAVKARYWPLAPMCSTAAVLTARFTPSPTPTPALGKFTASSGRHPPATQCLSLKCLA